MASLSTCHLGLWLGWQILLNNGSPHIKVKIIYYIVLHYISTFMFLCVAYTYHSKCANVCCRPRTHAVPYHVKLDPVVYELDAFICYNSKDREWVLTELLTRLKENKISSIIHDIDFLPGASVINMIGESMERSRFTVLVLSPDFLSSKWYIFELDSARTHAISLGCEVIVPIILR